MKQKNAPIKPELSVVWNASVIASLLEIAIFTIAHAGQTPIIGGLLTAFVVLVSYPIILITALRHQHIQYWLSVGILASITIDGSFLSLLNNLGLWFVAFQIVFLLLIPLLFWAIFNLIPKAVIRLMLAAVTSVLIIFTVTSVTSAINKASTKAFDNSQLQNTKQIIQNLDFRVYTPTYLPAGGYYLSGTRSNPAQGVHYQSDSPSNYFYSFAYVSTSTDSDKPPEFIVNSFRKTSRYSPPEKCGYEDPSIDLSYACQPIGTSRFGNTVYQTVNYQAHNDPNTGGTAYWFTTIGNTEVVLRQEFNERSSQFRPDITYNLQNMHLDSAEVIKVINSLVAKTNDELLKL